MATSGDKRPSGKGASRGESHLPGRQASLSAEELPDSVEHGEDVSMGPGAVEPGQPGVTRAASREVEPEMDEKG